jgi:hypothetical protein
MRIQWTLVVTAEAGDEATAGMRLRGLLKVAGRRFGMRCVAVGEERLAPQSVKEIRTDHLMAGKHDDVRAEMIHTSTNY